jgi:hypothetical protein
VSDACILGDYKVHLIKNGVALSSGRASLERVQYSRVLDLASTAEVGFATPGADCCGQLGAVDHWNTDLVIAEGEDELWRGPVRKVSYRRGRVLVEAVDMLGWLAKRLIPVDLTFSNKDVTDIFADIYDASVGYVDSPLYEIIRYQSGVTESRKIKASEYKVALSEVNEMLDAGLDVTTFGRYIIAGMPAFTPIALTDMDVQGDIEVVKDGDEFANGIVTDANSTIVSLYPPAPQIGTNGYPLVQARLYDPGLENQQSADNAAKARYDFSAKGIRRVRSNGGLILLPTAKIDQRRVLAGQLINFSATQTCYSAEETLRIGKITNTIEKGVETTTIDLQPIGSVAGLADIQ